jgi:hypothetical protein
MINKNLFLLKELKRNQKIPKFIIEKSLSSDFYNSKNEIIGAFTSKKRIYPVISNTWRDNVYSFDKGYVRHVPIMDLSASAFFKYYFNVYNTNIEKRGIKNHRRYILRYRRLSLNRILINDVQVEHTNTNVLINLSVFNPERIFLNKYLKGVQSVRFSKFKSNKFLKNARIYMSKNIFL